MNSKIDPHSDETLMCDYKNGDATAFDALYTRHKGGLYRYITRQLGGQTALAHELYQDVWMRVIQARSQYEPVALFSTWLYQIAHNRLVDYWRSVKPHDAIDDHEQTLHSQDPCPETLTEHQQTIARVRQAIGTLPHDQRDALLLKEEGQFSLEEIAIITGTTRETVKSRLRYAMDKLRSALL